MDIDRQSRAIYRRQGNRGLLRYHRVEVTILLAREEGILLIAAIRSRQLVIRLAPSRDSESRQQTTRHFYHNKTPLLSGVL